MDSGGPDSGRQATAETARVIVIGVGNTFRGDDGAGPAAVARLRARMPPDGTAAGVRTVCCDGDPVRLVDLWTDAALAVVVDAARAEPACPGRIHRLEPGATWPVRTTSSHGLGLGYAVALAHALGRLPGRLVVYAVEAADGSPGEGLTPAVAAALDPLVRRIRAEISHAGAALPVEQRH
ncbi:hydrogenase maturation protease [Streptomyces sp. NPDC006784]|uniref:hydrogenase maturation protease n=1 Tax=Streptomyces sp. NPDC006784 TaxID=3364764 RepID=UPI00367A982C